MKKFIAFIFAAALTAGAWAHQLEYTVDGVTWYYNLIDDGNGGYNAEITYRGYGPEEYYNEYSGSLVIPSTLGGYHVTTIGSSAFDGCSLLTSVTIPSSVTTIDSYVFYGCSSLTLVTMPKSVTTIGAMVFAKCIALITVYVAEGDASRVRALMEESGVDLSCVTFIETEFETKNEAEIKAKIAAIGDNCANSISQMQSFVADKWDNYTEEEKTLVNDWVAEEFVKHNKQLDAFVYYVETLSPSLSKHAKELVGSELVFALLNIPFDEWGDILTKLEDCYSINKCDLSWLLKNSSDQVAEEPERLIVLADVVNRIRLDFSESDGEEEEVDVGWVEDIEEVVLRNYSLFPDYNTLREKSGANNNGIDKLRLAIKLQKLGFEPIDESYNVDTVIESCNLKVEYRCDDYIVIRGPECTTTELVPVTQNGQTTYQYVERTKSIHHVIKNDKIHVVDETYNEYMFQNGVCNTCYTELVPITQNGQTTYQIKEVLKEASYIASGALWGLEKLHEAEDFNVRISSAMPHYLEIESSTCRKFFMFDFDNLDILTVPNEINGKKIVAIDNSVFSGLAGVRKFIVNGEIDFQYSELFAKDEEPEEVEIVEGTRYLAARFQNSNLKKITLPESLKMIKCETFYNCTQLESIVIPAGVTLIEDGAFSGCGSLTEVEFKGDAPDVQSDAFLGVPKRAVIKVPEGSIGWNGDMTDVLPTTWNGHLISHSKDVSSLPTIKPDDTETAQIATVVVTNAVVHYIMNSVQPEFAKPVSEDTGFVNVIAEAKGNNVAVPQTWAENYPDFAAKFGSDFTKALTAKSGKIAAGGREMLVWEDYVAGTDPTDPNDKFTASVTIVDGKPVVSYTPELDDARKALRKYTTYGKVKLTDAEWIEIPEGHEDDYNFFKVTVEMK